MNRSWLPFILLLLLSACGPDYSVYSGPDLAAAVAQATAAAKATQDEQFRWDRQATLSAGATKQVSQAEMERLDKEIMATQAAVHVQQTIDAGQIAVLAAQSTATAQALGTATAWPQTATPLAATQAAVIAQVQADQRAQERQQVIGNIEVWVNAILRFLLTAVLILAGGYTYYRFLNYWIDAKAHKARALESLSGTLVEMWDPDIEDYRWFPIANGPALRRLPSAVRSDLAATKVSPGGVTATGPMGQPLDDEQAMAIQLVQAAIDRAGGDARVIPSWRALNMTSDKWQAAKDLLQRMGIVESLDRRGTYLRQYNSLAELLHALKTGQVELSPTPGLRAG